MCKFCDNNGEHRIMSYSNHDSMDIYYGQYQGVCVSSSLTMKGNMLLLNASGSYRSRLDCYYEDEGLDIDSKYSINSKSSHFKIEFCPFCGKKLTSHMYEKEVLKDEIDELKYKLGETKEKAKNMEITIECSFTTSKGEYQTLRDMIWKNFEGDCKRTPIPLEVLMHPSLGKLKTKVSYNGSEDGYDYDNLDPEVGITFHGSSYGTFYSDVYRMTEEVYDKLSSLGLFPKNDKKMKEYKEKKAKIERKIQALTEKIKDLGKQLKNIK